MVLRHIGGSYVLQSMFMRVWYTPRAFILPVTIEVLSRGSVIYRLNIYSWRWYWSRFLGIEADDWSGRVVRGVRGWWRGIRNKQNTHI